MSAPSEATDPSAIGGAESEAQYARITEWAEANLGGKVTRIERQRRWRPVWRVAMDDAGETKEYVFKADRAWAAHPYPHIHEMNLLNVLAANDIPVPPQRGFCENPETIVMDWVKGGRDPGLVMEAVESASTMTPDRWSATLQYMEVLAAMHRVPVEQLEAIGCYKPVGPTELALQHYERFYAMQINQKIVDPLMDFATLWLRRNVPQHRTRISLVTGDCGQFLSEGPNLTCALDVEIGHLGDHLHDLACFRGRHPVENMGDLPTLFRHYEKALGEPLDLEVIAYHTVAFLGVGYFGPLFALARTDPGGDWVEAAVQCAFIGRRCVEALAECARVELEDLELPAPRPSPMEEMALQKLGADLRRLPLTERFAPWQRGVLSSVTDYLLNQARYRRWAEDTDLDEQAALLGTRPRDMAEADRLLAAFVAKAGPEHDADLIRLFHRRYLRQCLIIADGDTSHLAMMKVEPLLDGRMDRVGDYTPVAAE